MAYSQLCKWISAALLILSLACSTFYNAFQAYEKKSKELSVMHPMNRSEDIVDNGLPVHSGSRRKANADIGIKVRPGSRSKGNQDPHESSFIASLTYCFASLYILIIVASFIGYHFFCSKHHDKRLEKRAQREHEAEIKRNEEIRLQDIREKAEFAAMQLASVFIIYRPRTPREDEGTEP